MFASTSFTGRYFDGLGFAITEKIYAHGWLVMKDGKMSKSKAMPFIGHDCGALRPGCFTLLLDARDSILVNDGIFTPEDFIDRINYDLANDLGNLLNRTIAMINKYEDGFYCLQAGCYPFDQDLVMLRRQR